MLTNSPVKRLISWVVEVFKWSSLKVPNSFLNKFCRFSSRLNLFKACSHNGCLYNYNGDKYSLETFFETLASVLELHGPFRCLCGNVMNTIVSLQFI